MNALSGKLDLTKQYKIAGGYYVPLIDGGGETCENCGALIADVAIVESEGKQYHIGCDCAETLTSRDALENWNLAELKKRINRRKRFVAWCKKKLHTSIENDTTCWLYDTERSEWSPHFTYRISKESAEHVKYVKMFAKKMIKEPEKPKIMAGLCL